MTPKLFIFKKMTKKKFAIVGCGKLGTIVANAYINGLLDEYKLIGVYSRTKESAEKLAEKVNLAKNNDDCLVFESFDEMIFHKPDIIVETASIQAMRDLTIPALSYGISIITISIGVFADDNFYNETIHTALQNNAKVYFASGAIGGLDVLQTVTLMGGKHTVTFRTEKGPNSLKNTPVYDEKLQQESREVFSGNAKDAIAMFPTKVNVSVCASLASIGTENTHVSINSIPKFIGDDHRIEIKNEQVNAVIDVYSSKADIAGWSVVRVLRNIVSPIVF